MLAINYLTFGNQWRSFCDKVVNDDETVGIIDDNGKKIFLLNEKEYNELRKAQHNAEYWAMVDEALEQIATGKVVKHDIIEVDDV